MVRAMGPMAPRIENGPTQGGRWPRPGMRPGRGLERTDAGEMRRHAHRAAAVAAQSRRGHARRDGRRLAAARSARRALQIPGIVRAPVQQVRGFVGHQELGAVGRAQNQRARGAQPRDHDRVLAWDVALVEQAADLAAIAGVAMDDFTVTGSP